MFRPDLASLAVGDCISINGVLMRHRGGGHFEPAEVGEPMLKRFDPNEGEPLHRWVA